MLDNKRELFVFAGPNGSGKSTIIKHFLEQSLCPPLYICPDSLIYDYHSAFPIPPELLHFYLDTLSNKDFTERLHSSGIINKTTGTSNPKPTKATFEIAMDKAQQLRNYALEIGASFTVETVFSTNEKLEFIIDAAMKKYMVTVIYVVTTSPEINIKRIHERVAMGGIDVPVEKVRRRYYKSLNLMPSALEFADCAFVFDNSDGLFPILHKEDNEYYLLNKEKRDDQWTKEYLINPLIYQGASFTGDLTVDETKERNL